MFIQLYTQLINMLVDFFDTEKRAKKQIEDYLNEATSIEDLELRYKELGM